MTAHSSRILTEAETSLVEAHAAAANWLPGGDIAAKKRTSAVEALQTNGLPTKRVEAFHYTDLRASLAKGFQPSERPTFNDASSAMLDYDRLVSALRLPIVNGHYFADMGDDLPLGVTVLPGFRMGEATPDIADVVETINTAFVTDGVNIELAADTHLEGTMTIANSFVGDAGFMQATRNSVTLQSKAKARILDRFCGNDQKSYLSSSVVNIELHPGAELDYILAVEEGDLAQRLARLNVNLHQDATLNLYILAAGGQLVRQEINFEMLGENADLNINGVNLIGGDAHIDITSRIMHHAPNTTAEETFRNVVTGRGRGVFQGQIRVAQAAQLTDAQMACNTLLLSDDCDFSAKPELEIFADDVQCAHGATVTDLEESYIFYLMARGISRTTARRMLIKAFVTEIIEELDDETLVEALDSRIDSWMETHI